MIITRRLHIGMITKGLGDAKFLREIVRGDRFRSCIDTTVEMVSKADRTFSRESEADMEVLFESPIKLELV